MKHRNSHFAVGYWSRIRAGRAVPDQADIDPKALKRLLPYVFLLDVRPDSTFTYRLAGTALCERFGVELRNHNFLAHWDRESRATLATLLRQSIRTRMPLCLTSIGATEDCRMIEIETVLMPITFGAREPERFLAVAHVLGDTYPLAGGAIAFERLVASNFIQEGDAIESSPPTGGSGSDWAGHPRAPHLRLVTSRETATEPSRFDMGEALNALFAQFGAAPARGAD
jgi:hypothetical protein